MKNFILLLGHLLIAYISLHSQNLAIIQDPDGFTNIRAYPKDDKVGGVVGSIYNGQIFAIYDLSCEEEGIHEYGTWIPVYLPEEFPSLDANYLFAGGGVIHISRINFLDCTSTLLEEIKQDQFYVKKDGIEITVAYHPFKAENHTISIQEIKYSYKGKLRSRYEYLIDGEVIKGGDRLAPTKTESPISLEKRNADLRAGAYGGFKEIGSIDIKIEDQIVEIPKVEFRGLFDLHRPQAYSDKSGLLVLSMAGRDGAGGYTVAFAFKNKEYIGRYVFGTL